MTMFTQLSTHPTCLYFYSSLCSEKNFLLCLKCLHYSTHFYSNRGYLRTVALEKKSTRNFYICLIYLFDKNNHSPPIFCQKYSHFFALMFSAVLYYFKAYNLKCSDCKILVVANIF